MDTVEKTVGNGNLKPWKKGESGNPNGRPPKGYSITEWFQNMLHSRPEVKEAMGNSILKKALEGDATAQKLIWNYMDGMPLQKGEINVTQYSNEELDRRIAVAAAIVGQEGVSGLTGGEGEKGEGEPD